MNIEQLEPHTFSRLLGMVSDVSLIINSQGVVEDVSTGQDMMASLGCQAWIGKRWKDTVTVESKQKIQDLLENGGYRLLLHHARLCLMLGDHYYSSCGADKKEKWGEINLYANTDQKGLKQKLDEHLVA